MDNTSYKEKNEIFKQIDLICKKYQDYLGSIVNKEKNLNYKIILMFSVLNKSLSIIEAYKILLPTNNLMALNGLTRMQLDNCIFIHGVYLLYQHNIDIDSVCKDLLSNNKIIRNYKVTPRLTDRYVVEDLDKKYKNQIKELYKFHCNFVHFSDRALLSSSEIIKDNLLRINLSNDYKKFESNVITNGFSFVELSKFVLILLKKEWGKINYNCILVK